VLFCVLFLIIVFYILQHVFVIILTKLSQQHQRITFRFSTLMHSVYHQNCPPYLLDLVEFVNDDPTKRRLPSATTRTMATVRARTKLGDRAFSVAAPSTWNSLPPHLRHIDSHYQFRKPLKTSVCFPLFLYFYMYIGWLEMLNNDDYYVDVCIQYIICACLFCYRDK